MATLGKPYEKIEDITHYFQSLYGVNSFDFQLNRYNKALEKYKDLYGYNQFYVASSSGRVEICGNHTDHNGGKVLCSAISLDSLAFFMPTNDGVITIKSEGYDEFKIDTKLIENSFKPNSRSLVKGVCDGLIKRGYKVGGFTAYVTSNVLGGAGISSSASFELLIAEILNFLYNDCKVSCEEKAIISQYSENVFYFKPCGLLDQTAISYGGVNLLDFSSKEKIRVKNCNVTDVDFKFVLVNTGGSHDNLTEEYASIPREMKSVANFFGVDRLINVKEQEFYDNAKQISNQCSDRAFLRAKHFFDENKRAEDAFNSLNNLNYVNFFNQLIFSGESSLKYLQNCSVSSDTNQPITRALALLSTLQEVRAVRIHGGGFAGCVLCAVKNDDLASFIEKTSKWYDACDIIPLSIREKGAIVL